jgi:hypothetical protein
VDERALPSIDSGREACVGKLTARVGTPPIGSMASLGDDTLRLASAALASSICMFASAGATPWRVGVGILGLQLLCFFSGSVCVVGTDTEHNERRPSKKQKFPTFLLLLQPHFPTLWVTCFFALWLTSARVVGHPEGP